MFVKEFEKKLELGGKLGVSDVIGVERREYCEEQSVGRLSKMNIEKNIARGIGIVQGRQFCRFKDVLSFISI